MWCEIRKCAWGECVLSEQSSVRAKAVELWCGREWRSAWESCGSGVAGSPLSALGASGLGHCVSLAEKWLCGGLVL